MRLTEVMGCVSEVTGVSKEKIMSKERFLEVVKARHLYCHFARKYTDYPLSVIGKSIGRDHTTVINSLRTASDLIDTKFESFVEKVFAIEEHICRNYAVKDRFLVYLPKGVGRDSLESILRPLGGEIRP